MCAAKSLYKAPAVRTPTVKYLRETAAKFGFDMTDDELKEYQGYMTGALAEYDVMDKYAEPMPEVKYPRLPGYRPPAEENLYNAWYYKTDIKGNSSGLLQGKKIAIKDNVAVAGVPMMNGSKLLEGYTPEFDATVVSRILDAGGHILGKSACEDLCLSGSSFTSGKGPILNVHDKTRSAGGSSGGSAVLIAKGEVDMAIGGDQGGSIRIPACYNGVVGLKPTYGLVPYTGAMSIEPTVDHLGPMAKTAYDCALMLEVIAGYDDGLDARQPPNIQVPKYTEALTGNLEGMKIGIVTEGFEETESDVESIVREAALKLKSVGAVVEEVSIQIHKDSQAIWGPVCLEGGYQATVENNSRPFGLKGFHPTSMIDHFAKALKASPNDLSITMKYACLFGKFIKETNYNHFYSKGSNVVRTLTNEYNKVLNQYNVLVMPTIRFKAPKLPGPDVTVTDYLTKALNMLANTCGFDVTGHPAMSINAAFSSENIPVGMSIIGKHWDEATMLNVAYAYEQIQQAAK